MRWETLRSIAFGSISGTYAGIGSALDNPARLIKVVNTTDVNIFISDNGIDDRDIVPAGGFFLYDLMSNRSEQSGLLVLDQGARLYAKGAPSSGSVYFTVVYASSY